MSKLLNIGVALSLFHMGGASSVRPNIDTARFEPVNPIIAPSSEIPAELKELIANKYYVPIRGLATEGTHIGETFGRSMPVYSNWKDGTPLEFYATGEYTPGSGVVIPFISFNEGGKNYTLPLMFPGNVPLGLSIDPNNLSLTVRQSTIPEYRRAGLMDPAIGFDTSLYYYTFADGLTGYEAGGLMGVLRDWEGGYSATILGGLQQGNSSGEQAN